MALRVADELAKVCGTVTLVGDPVKYADLGIPVVADRWPGQGPLAGIDAALSNTSAQYNLIVACDMPSVSQVLVEAVFLAAAGADCAVPRHDDGRIEPLCAVYHRRCQPAIAAALEAGIRKATDIPPLLERQQLAVRYVQVSDPAAFANLNTPEDWRRFHHG